MGLFSISGVIVEVLVAIPGSLGMLLQWGVGLRNSFAVIGVNGAHITASSCWVQPS